MQPSILEYKKAVGKWIDVVGATNFMRLYIVQAVRELVSLG